MLGYFGIRNLSSDQTISLNPSVFYTVLDLIRRLIYVFHYFILNRYHTRAQRESATASTYAILKSGSLVSLDMLDVALL